MPVGSAGYQLGSKWKYRVTRVPEENAMVLAELVSSLSAVTRLLNSLRVDALDSEHRSSKPKAVPSSVLADAADVLNRVITQITASADDASDTAIHMWEGNRMKATIGQVADKLRVAQGSAGSWEERALQRFLIEAGSVRRETSPAHPHMAECWLQAATHMRLSVAARTASYTAEGARRTAMLRSCSKAYEALASVTFSDAATYFAKAATRLAIPQASELWKEAAELTLELGLKQIHRVEEESAQVVFKGAALDKRTAAEHAMNARAAACAACAAAMDGLTVTEVEAAISLLPRTTPTEAVDSTAALNGSVAGVSYAVLALSMRLLLVQIGRVPLVETADPHPHPGGHDAVRFNLCTAVTDVLLLCQSALVEIPSFPVGHLLHQPAPLVEAIQQRDQLLRGLCCAAIGCSAYYRQLVESYPTRGSRFHHLALLDLETALTLMRSIIRYAFNPSADQHFDVNTCDRSLPTSYEQALRYVVQCHRRLAACRSALARRGLAHALMDLAASKVGVNTVIPVRLPDTVSNAVVKRAWQLYAAADAVPQSLLFPVPREDTREGSAARQQAILDAIEQLYLQKFAISPDCVEYTREVRLRNAAMKHYGRGVAVGVNIMGDDTSSRAGVKSQRQNDAFTRLSRAASWCASAADACLAGKPGVADLYERAVLQAVIVDTTMQGLRRKMGPDGAAQQLGDRAGLRFAEAATALAAGNMPLYECWLRAAEATAELVELTTPKGGSAEPKLTFSASYSKAAVQAANALEADAVARQGGEAEHEQAADAGRQPAGLLRAAQQSSLSATAAGCGRRLSGGSPCAAADAPSVLTAKRRKGNN
jgi:hypothetical protein